jgi:hypothetical protein
VQHLSRRISLARAHFAAECYGSPHPPVTGQQIHERQFIGALGLPSDIHSGIDCCAATAGSAASARGARMGVRATIWLVRASQLDEQQTPANV